VLRREQLPKRIREKKMARKYAAGFLFAGTMILASLWTASGFLHGSSTPAWGLLKASNPCISRPGISKMGVIRIPSTKRENGPVMKLTIPASNIKIDWGKPVAAGGFGAVYFAQTIEQEDVVVKVAFSDDFSERLLENEGHFNDKLASSVPQCNGRNWARFMGEFKIGNKFQGFPKEVSSRRALVFRREQGNTLDNFLAGPASDLEKAISLYTSGSSTVLRVELFKKVLGELLCSIAHLHSRGILHRDIKPENVLVTPGDKISPLKLIDLGSGCDIATKDRRGLYDETIDPIYAPPEQVVDLAFPGNYDSYCAAVTAIRVLFPSLGADVDVCLKWREELAACNSDLVAWCESKADSGKSACFRPLKQDENCHLSSQSPPPFRAALQ
jgi:serine/threonine protein kinase